MTQTEFQDDLRANYAEMARFGIRKTDAPYFLPPYEWYNDSVASWTAQEGLTLISFTPGTLSHADYTTPEMKNYRSSNVIIRSVLDYEGAHGLNGFILLMHIGSGPERSDKLYARLGEIVEGLKAQGYSFVEIENLLRD